MVNNMNSKKYIIPKINATQINGLNLGTTGTLNYIMTER